jgi:hypothetical protein
MDYKPGDLFLGVIDFFGILVPGAVLLFMERQWLDRVLGGSFDHYEKWMWAAFLLGAYVLGHFLLGLGVPFNRLIKFYSIDQDALYKSVKSRIKVPNQIDKESRGFFGPIQNWFHRFWQRLADERTPHFYRAYAFVRLKSASALSEIDRQMADYKLFRSLMLVFALDFFLCLFYFHSSTQRTALSGILCILAIWRFVFLLHWTYQITFEFYDLLKPDSGPAILE